MDENEIREDSLTPAEAEAVEETGMSGEEAHRYEEFEELRSMLADVRDLLEGLKTDIADLAQQRAAVLVESGAVVTDDGETAVIDDEDYDRAFDELDLTID